MKIVNIGAENSIFNQFIAEIRDIKIQDDPLRFRRNIERIGEIFAYEISKDLPYAERGIKTPLGVADMQIPDGFPILATILRAGLPLHSGLLNYFDRSGNAFISAYRKYIDQKEFVIEFEYLASPSLEGKNSDLIRSNASNRFFVRNWLQSIARKRYTKACAFSSCNCKSGRCRLCKRAPTSRQLYTMGRRY